ncbi:hypothetical protein JTB14_021099 [Gonioctena quinquepunctata]|nr:hypothetical protein JTB14_021099 [Gonioctena quinquepunctata]
MTTYMTEETFQKFMRFSIVREVWLELHILYDGNAEDKMYDLCSQFFNFKRHRGDDIATHTSELKNLWNELQVEIAKDEEVANSSCKCNLPEILLICKMLGILPDEYFLFRSSWLLMAKAESRTDNVTNQLYAYEKALLSKSNHNQEALILEKASSNEPNMKQKKAVICNYCKAPGHIVRYCMK